MATYTIQQLTDAYVASTGIAIEEIEAKKIEVQEELDSQRTNLIARIDYTNTYFSNKLDKLQSRLDNTPLLAKEKMKNVAIAYLMSQIKEQTQIDNADIEL